MQMLKSIVIHNKSYGELDGIEIYLTQDLYDKLESQKMDSGKTMIDALKEGKALQGLKHLIELIRESNKKAQIIFNLKFTKKQNDDYFINFDEYKRKSREGFFPLYRETGLNAAKSYLNKYFPSNFEYKINKLGGKEVSKVDNNLPAVLETITQKDKNKVVLIEEVTRTIKDPINNKVYSGALLGLQKQSNISSYQQILDEFRQRLNKDIHETRGKDCWQNWIYKNNWLFGIRYLKPISKERIGFNSIPDFLFPTLDGFLDILEIKKTKFDVLTQDEDHPGSYSWCHQTNKAIGQVVNYIQEIEKFQSTIAERINEKYSSEYGIDIFSVKPRAFILVGNSKDWDSKRRKVLRLMNYSLHGIEILTYFDLLKRGEGIVSMLKGE